MSEIICVVGMRFVPSEKPDEGSKLSVAEEPSKDAMVCGAILLSFGEFQAGDGGLFMQSWGLMAVVEVSEVLN